MPATTTAAAGRALTEETTQATPPDARVQVLSDEYEEPQGYQTLDAHPSVRVVTGSDRPDRMRDMKRHGLVQVRQGALAADRTPIVRDEELCDVRTQDDGVAYLWYNGGPLWMETWKHWQSREEQRQKRRRQRFGREVTLARQAVEQPGITVASDF